MKMPVSVMVAAICIISWAGFSIQSVSIVALIAYSAICMT